MPLVLGLFRYLWNRGPEYLSGSGPGYPFQDTISGFNIYYLVPTTFTDSQQAYMCYDAYPRKLNCTTLHCSTIAVAV